MPITSFIMLSTLSLSLPHLPTNLLIVSLIDARSVTLEFLLNTVLMSSFPFTQERRKKQATEKHTIRK